VRSTPPQQVAGLDVAVHDALAVRVVEAGAGAERDRQDLVGLEPAALAQKLGAGLALDVLHHDVVLVTGVVESRVEDLHDVRMDEARGGERLALEARHERRVGCEVLGEQLDGDVTLEALVEREVHCGHVHPTQPALRGVAPAITISPAGIGSCPVATPPLRRSRGRDRAGRGCDPPACVRRRSWSSARSARSRRTPAVEVAALLVTLASNSRCSVVLVVVEVLDVVLDVLVVELVEPGRAGCARGAGRARRLGRAGLTAAPLVGLHSPTGHAVERLQTLADVARSDASTVSGSPLKVLCSWASASLVLGHSWRIT